MIDNNLYNIRTEKKMTQKEFAEKAGLNPNVYSRYERGESDMTLKTAKKIAEAHKISIDEIAGAKIYDDPYEEIEAYEEKILELRVITGDINAEDIDIENIGKRITKLEKIVEEAGLTDRKAK